MITTVTTTTTTAVATFGAGSLALVAICTTLVLLFNKEILLSTKKPWAMRLSKRLNVALVPLVVVFVVTIVMKIASVLH